MKVFLSVSVYWVTGISVVILFVAGCQSTASVDEMRPSTSAPYKSKAYQIYHDGSYSYFTRGGYNSSDHDVEKLRQLPALDVKHLSIEDFYDIMNFCRRYDRLKEKQKSYQSHYVQQALDQHKCLREELRVLYEYEKYIKRSLEQTASGYYQKPSFSSRMSAKKETKHLTLKHRRLMRPINEDININARLSLYGYDGRSLVNEKIWESALSGNLSPERSVWVVDLLNETLCDLKQRYAYTYSYAQQTQNPLIINFLSDAKIKLDAMGEFIGKTKEYFKPYLDQAAADQKRQVSEPTLSQDHLIRSYVARKLSNDRFEIQAEVGVAIESVSVHGMYVDVQLRYFKVPFPNTREFGTVIAYYEGVNLGSPVDSKVFKLPAPAKLSKEAFKKTFQETLCYYRFEADSSFPPKGEINILARCPEVQLDSKISYSVIGTVTNSPTEASDFSGVISCRREQDHLYVPVSLNIHGVPVVTELLLDTGASIANISESLYRQGNGRPLASLPHLSLHTANGEVRVPTDDIEIRAGEMTRTTKTAIHQGGVGLLGVSFFSGYTYTVDVENSRILVSPVN